MSVLSTPHRSKTISTRRTPKIFAVEMNGFVFDVFIYPLPANYRHSCFGYRPRNSFFNIG